MWSGSESDVEDWEDRVELYDDAVQQTQQQTKLLPAKTVAAGNALRQSQEDDMFATMFDGLQKAQRLQNETKQLKEKKELQKIKEGTFDFSKETLRDLFIKQFSEGVKRIKLDRDKKAEFLYRIIADVMSYIGDKDIRTLQTKVENEIKTRNKAAKKEKQKKKLEENKALSTDVTVEEELQNKLVDDSKMCDNMLDSTETDNNTTSRQNNNMGVPNLEDSIHQDTFVKSFGVAFVTAKLSGAVALSFAAKLLSVIMEAMDTGSLLQLEKNIKEELKGRSKCKATASRVHITSSKNMYKQAAAEYEAQYDYDEDEADECSDEDDEYFSEDGVDDYFENDEYLGDTYDVDDKDNNDNNDNNDNMDGKHTIDDNTHKDDVYEENKEHNNKNTLHK